MKSLLFLLLIGISTSSLTTKEQLQKNWKLEAIEEFGKKWPLDAKNKNDYMYLKSDGTYSMILFGAEKSGTWTFNEKGKTINFKNESESFYFKFFEVTENTLAVEWQQPSLIRSKLHYTVQIIE